MRAPEALRKLSRRFVQDVELIGKTPEEVVDFALQALNQDERRIVEGFLDGLLNGGYSAKELQALWWSLPSDIVFQNDGQLISFLSLIRERL
jgi:hypothetical protein